jgi:hypothetical protein
MREMARRLGISGSLFQEEPREALKKALRIAFESGTIEQLYSGFDLKLRERSREEYQTPTGKIELASSIAVEPIAPLPEQLPFSEEVDHR